MKLKFVKFVKMTSMKYKGGYFVCTYGLCVGYITAAILAVVFAVLQNVQGEFENDSNLLM